MQPVDGAPGSIFGHTFDLVIEGPAIVAVEIALELGKEIGNEGVEVARGDTGANVREKPALHAVVDLARAPMAFFRGTPAGVLIDGAQEFRALRKDGLRE